MMKCLGAILIIGGCFSLGIDKKNQLKERVFLLKQLQSFLNMTAAEIGFGHSTLADCCRQISRRMDSPFRECLQKVYELCTNRDGKRFEEVFRSSFTELFRGRPITKEDAEQFMAFLKSGTFLDPNMQRRTVEKCSEEIAKKISLLEQENHTKCKMAVTLATMAGVFLVIVLL